MLLGCGAALEESLVVELMLAIPGTHNSGKTFLFCFVLQVLQVTQMALGLSDHEDLSLDY